FGTIPADARPLPELRELFRGWEEAGAQLAIRGDLECRGFAMIADMSASATRRALVSAAADAGPRGAPWYRTCEQLVGGGYGNGTQRHAARSRECGCEVCPLGQRGDRHRRLYGEQRPRPPLWQFQGHTLRPGRARPGRRGVTGRDSAVRTAWRITVVPVALATEEVDGGAHRLQKHLIPSSSDGGSS